MKTFLRLIAIPLFALAACSPRPVVPVLTEPEEETQPVDLGPCATWLEYGEVERNNITDNHVIYVDALKTGDYDLAREYWRMAYEAAPAADGKRRSHFEDGIKIFHHYFEQAGTDTEKRQMIDRVMSLYDHMDQCFGEGGYVAGRKGFDYFYKYREYTTDQRIFDLFRSSMDEDGMETNYFVINPFTSLVINFFAQDRIPMEEAQHYVGLIRDVVEHAVENCGDEQECEAWTIVEEYSLARLEELEGVRGFYDCEYYKIKYFADFEAHPDSCEVLRDVYSVLRYGGCIPEDPMLEEIKAGLDEKCRVAREPGPLRLAYNALEEGQFTEAIEKFDEYVENTEDPERKAQFKLIASKIYYAHLKDFPSARRYALEAASYRDNWGEPYILIGKLYASSGPLCGPGRGWDSQIVTWAAIDKFAYAKQIDPSVTAEANQWISTYSRYMPSMEDIFQRNLQVGQPFRVPCWIQENTSIRPAPRS